jgi:hypothetical protein
VNGPDIGTITSSNHIPTIGIFRTLATPSSLELMYKVGAQKNIVEMNVFTRKKKLIIIYFCRIFHKSPDATRAPAATALFHRILFSCE